MTLRTRLAITVGVVIVLGSLGSGVITAAVTRDSALSRIDAVLTEGLDRVRRDPDRDTSVLVGFADSSPIPISATLFFADDDPIPLVEGMEGGSTVTVPVLSVAQVDEAMDGPLRVAGSLLVRTIEVADDEWVTIAASTREVSDQFRGSLVRSLQVSFLIALPTVFVVWWLIRRSLRPVAALTEDASRIAAGNLDVSLLVVEGRHEISRLSGALASMVKSLREAVAVTARSERDMREFLGDASHELRTPLTVIRGYIDILASGKDLTEEQQERAWRRLVGESQRMAGIIDDLLMLAEVGEVPAARTEPVDVSRLIDDHAHDLKVRQPERQVDLDIEPGVLLHGDPAQLQRVMANMFSNIERHTPDTSRVNVSLSSDDSCAVLTFDDAGPGLSAEMYGRSTTGFQRFDRARSADGGGFGLGLAIVTSVVSAHRGTIEMCPSPVGGLRTRIVLPRAPAW